MHTPAAYSEGLSSRGNPTSHKGHLSSVEGKKAVAYPIKMILIPWVFHDRRQPFLLTIYSPPPVGLENSNRRLRGGQQANVCVQLTRPCNALLSTRPGEAERKIDEVSFTHERRSLLFHQEGITNSPSFACMHALFILEHERVPIRVTESAEAFCAEIYARFPLDKQTHRHRETHALRLEKKTNHHKRVLLFIGACCCERSKTIVTGAYTSPPYLT